jgi:VanZ family protein
VILLLAAYAGLLPHSSGDSSIPPSLQPNDKLLHFITFFALSLTFYWIIDTSRRRTLHLALVICTLALGVGSEAVQALIPNGRSFDPFDVLANVVGSLGAIGLCTWYHRRMLERRRKARFGALLEEAHEDVELGLNTRNAVTDIGSPQETGVTPARSLEQEIDNWDENAVDEWEEGDGDASGPNGAAAGIKASPGAEDPKKRSD